jgi:hypothetical protein
MGDPDEPLHGRDVDVPEIAESRLGASGGFGIWAYVGAAAFGVAIVILFMIVPFAPPVP